MALSWNEIKDRAVNFSKEWAEAASEEAEAKTFWDELFTLPFFEALIISCSQTKKSRALLSAKSSVAKSLKTSGSKLSP